MRPVHQLPVQEDKAEETSWSDDFEEKEGSGDAAQDARSRDLRRVLQRLYYSRARVLSKTVESFAEGFREGMRDVKRQ